MLGAIIEANKLGPWVHRLRKSSGEMVTPGWTIMEYTSSPHVFKLGQDYDYVVAKLRGHDITVIDAGLCETPDSTRLCSVIIQDELDRLAKAYKKNKTPEKAAENQETTDKSWEGILAKSQSDLSLACEGHIRGLPFVSADRKFYEHFGLVLERNNLITYHVNQQWLTSAVALPPT
ncbi:hypothetical protein ABW21_db0205963 [Orbilia brochopaga]|nr:hypothetical protein ABW21_db0205963 [Drechslerella brochopaga]